MIDMGDDAEVSYLCHHENVAFSRTAVKVAFA
jgi:hypothetical protein